MILKLMKYEIKSTYKVFFTILASFVLLTILLCMSMKTPNTIMILIFSGACFVIGGGTFFAYLITLFNRYYKNLYGREGYLMLTLPVKGWELVCSKFAIAMFWNIILIIAVILCSLAVAQFIFWTMPSDMIQESYTLIKLIQKVMEEQGCYIYCTLLSVIVGIGVTISRIYFVISVAYLPAIKKGNIPIALLLYFVIKMIEGFIMSNFLRAVFFTYSHYSFFFTSFTPTINMLIEGKNPIIFFSMIGVCLATIGIFLAGCSYIITKKVNIK